MNDLERAKAILPELVENRRYLHQHPEIGMGLKETTEYVVKKLEEMGYEPKICGKCGVTATVGGKNGGPVFLLRADMDALPMKEESGLEFSACGNKAHTCGHDMHTAMLLGAAKLLKEEEDKLPGTVKFMFQPAEETLEGAVAMIEDGILENPHVDAAMGAHMRPMAPTGFIAYNVGAVSSSSDIFYVHIEGKGGHGASPQDTIDPINVGVHIHLALQELIARETDPAEQVVLTLGMFQAGDATNIIPSKAVLGGSLRTYNEELRRTLKERIKTVVEMTAEMFRAKASLEIVGSTCSMVIDKDVAEPVGKAFTELFGRGTMKMNERMSGSEDFAEISARVPSMFFVVGGGTIEDGYAYGGHHPKVRFDENSLPFGVAAYVGGAKAWLAANRKE